jgi:uncharacterized protein
MNSKARGADLRRLDIVSAARDGSTLAGTERLAGFERLREGDAAPQGEVQWSAQASQRPRSGAAPEVRLRLRAAADIERICQRCLQPVRLPLEVQRDFLLVAGEAQAAALDADNDQEDVLELTRPFDLQALIEDELLLALPLVPRHEQCPQPLGSVAYDAPPADEAPPHPFAALAALRRGDKP